MLILVYAIDWFQILIIPTYHYAYHFAQFVDWRKFYGSMDSMRPEKIYVCFRFQAEKKN